MCVLPFTRHLNDAAAESAKTAYKVKRMKDGESERERERRTMEGREKERERGEEGKMNNRYEEEKDEKVRKGMTLIREMWNKGGKKR